MASDHQSPGRAWAGSPQNPCTAGRENIAYIQKSGKWENSKKHGTFIPGTFEEWGERPQQASAKENSASMETLRALIKKGKNNAEIYEEEPKFMRYANTINAVRNDIRHADAKGTFRLHENKKSIPLNFNVFLYHSLYHFPK